MITQIGNAMIQMMLVKFMLNDVPHASGLYDNEPHYGGSTVGSLFSRWGIEAGDTIRMYHFTRKENLDSILSYGLSPKLMTGVRKTIKSDITQGTYLSPTIEDSRGVLEDYNLQEVRVPGMFSLLEITLPNDWPADEDRDVAHRYQEPPTVITEKPIPPSMIKILDENFFEVELVGAEYREVTDVYAQIGDRVRIKHGEYAGEDGFIVEFAGRMEDNFAIWKIALDSGTIIEDREDKVVALYK